MAIAADLRDRIDLAGAWQLAFDPAGQGVADGWASGAWPQDAGGDRPGAGCLGADPPGRRGHWLLPQGLHRSVGVGATGALLRFGGASYRTDVWLNGSFLGSHEGSYTPFWFDATAAARIGDENELVVRVAGLSKHQDVDGQPLLAGAHFQAALVLYRKRPVGRRPLEAVPSLSIHDAVIQPDVRNEKVIVEVVTRNAHDGVRSATLALAVRSPAGTVVHRWERVTIPPGVASLSYRLELPRPQRWSCETRTSTG